MTNNIILIGFMGAGKTTVGRELAKKLKRPFVDLDDYITNQYRHTPREIFAEQGEAAFRQIEHEQLADILARDNQVIASGGGIVETASNNELLQQAQIVWLAAEFSTVLPRLLENDARPLVHQHTLASFHDLYQRREVLYGQLAHFRIQTEGKTPSRIIEEIQTQLVEEHRELATLRSQIDSIDRQMMQLLEQRLIISESIASYKHQHHLAIVQPDRMQLLLAKLQEDSALPEKTIQDLMVVLFQLTIAHEHTVSE